MFRIAKCDELEW
jgi:hypothetical protein